jgi:hypothetical protein
MRWPIAKRGIQEQLFSSSAIILYLSRQPKQFSC